MNKKQLFIMWAGIGVIVFMGVFPPVVTRVQGIDLFVGYGFIAQLKPQPSAEKEITMRKKFALIDFTRLLTQWGIVSALTAGFIITFKDKKDNPN